MLLTIPVGVFQLWSPTPFWAFFWVVALSDRSRHVSSGPTWALVQTLAPPTMRAFAIAFMFFILNIISLGLAPLWVGGLSDFLPSALEKSQVYESR
ncbi:MAG: hypothetical protein R3C40_03295 [Parvularculaceae bacterium]